MTTFKLSELSDVQKDVLRFLHAETAGETRRYVEVCNTYAYLVVRTSSHAAIRWDAFACIPERFDRGFSTVRAAFSVRLSTVMALAQKELIQIEKHGRSHAHLTQLGKTVASSLGEESQ